MLHAVGMMPEVGDSGMDPALIARRLGCLGHGGIGSMMLVRSIGLLRASQLSSRILAFIIRPSFRKVHYSTVYTQP